MAIFKMDFKTQHSFCSLQVENFSSCKLALALPVFCQILQLKITSVIFMISSHSTFWLCLGGIMKASEIGDVNLCAMCGSHDCYLLNKEIWKRRSKSSRHTHQHRKLDCLKERTAIELPCMGLFYLTGSPVSERSLKQLQLLAETAIAVWGFPL